MRGSIVGSTVLNFAILDDSEVTRDLDLAAELYHRINRVIPKSQSILSVEPTVKASDAIETMRKYRYSQVPVINGTKVLGIFSFRSFAVEAARYSLDDIQRQRCAPGDIPVEDLMEPWRFAHLEQEFADTFDAMDADNGILVGEPNMLVGILTPMDVLRHLNQVAAPFVYLLEIELTTRALLQTTLSAEEIADAARRCLQSAYGGPDKVPTTLEEMTFDNYSSIVSFGEHWPKLQKVFGGTRERAQARFKEIGLIRNDVFHFRREIHEWDLHNLKGCRDSFRTKLERMPTCSSRGDSQ